MIKLIIELLIELTEVSMTRLKDSFWLMFTTMAIVLSEHAHNQLVNVVPLISGDFFHLKKGLLTLKQICILMVVDNVIFYI